MEKKIFMTICLICVLVFTTTHAFATSSSSQIDREQLGNEGGGGNSTGKPVNTGNSNGISTNFPSFSTGGVDSIDKSAKKYVLQLQL